jgi:outer membrane protein TolC
MADSYVELLRKMDSDVQNLIAEGVATKADGLSVKVKLNEAEMMQDKVSNGLHLSKMLLCQICGLDVSSEIALADETVETLPQTYTNTRAIDLDQAYTDRPELKSLDLVKKIVEKKEDVVRSEMLPTLALTANYLVTNPNAFNGFQTKFSGMWNVGVVLHVPIFHFGEKAYNLRAAKADTRIKQLELDDAKEKIELQINQSIFKVDEAGRMLKAADKNIENAKENLRYAQLGFKEGVISALNLMEAQTAWLKAQSELIDAQIEVKLSNTYLYKAIGKLDDANK